jgi:hypothetical protein
VGARSTRYLVMMAIRVVCLLLMVFVTPYGWYTWLFAVGAVVLPYIAVVSANVGQDSRPSAPESPERALPAPAAATPVPPRAEPVVIRVEEQGRLSERPAHPDADA